MSHVELAAHMASRGTFRDLQDDREVIVFVGPQKRFSKTLLRNVEAECPEFRSERFDTLKDYLATVTSEDETQARVLIVDRYLCAKREAQFHSFADDFRERNQQIQPPGIAVAYANGDELKDMLARFREKLDLRGFVPMNMSIDIWLSIIRLLANGGQYYPPDVLLASGIGAAVPTRPQPEQAANTAPPSDASILERLTQREYDVIKQVSNGLQNKQIASLLGVSEHTVKLHIHHIITKLEVRNRTEAAAKYLTLNPKT